MLDWSRDQIGQFRIERVALGDLDCALKLAGEKLLDHRIGNVMWRARKDKQGRELAKHQRCFLWDSW